MAVGAALAWNFGLLSTKHTVPSIAGLTLAEASSLVKNDGLTLDVTAHVASTSVATGDIVSQSPAAGTSLAGGKALSVTVSSGPPAVPVTLPALVGFTCAVDTAKLATMHVSATCPSTSAISSTAVSSGLVAGWLYGITKNPTAVPRGSSIVLENSLGASTVATTTTSAAGPTTTSTSTTTSTTTTTTTTTTPVATLAMPNLVGMDQAQVYAALHTAGLFYTTRGPGAGTSTTNGTWTKVVSSIPAAGTKVPARSTVTLNVTK